MIKTPDPLVTIVIPTYNRDKLVDRAISSVIDQTYKNWELLIIDDSSTDDTEKLIHHSYSENSRITFLKRSNDREKGANACRNIGIENANGEFIAFLDSDDEWHEDHLEKKIYFLEKEGVDGVFSGYVAIVKTSLGKEKLERHEKRLPKYKGKQNIGNYLFTNKNSDIRTSTLVLKTLNCKSIKFDEALQKHQDWDFAIRFDEKYKLIVEASLTVNIFTDRSDRMSSRLNHIATNYFLKKHSDKLSTIAKAGFLLSQAKRTLLIECKSENYYKYRNRLLNINNNLYWKSRLPLLDMPLLGNVILYAWKKYLKLKLK